MLIGILSLQGDFYLHEKAFDELDVSSIEVKTIHDFDKISALVIPGGESTVILKYIIEERLEGKVIDFYKKGNPIWGTCAGAILIAKTVSNPIQHSLGLIDITVERNAYGRQVDSFITEAVTVLPGGKMEIVCIRAPKIQRVGKGVTVLAKSGEEVFLVRQGTILASTFHPELTDDRRVQRYFLSMIKK
ncbi:glutamine amidotransferase subunit PdxT [Candidatus Gottesmanbacteria bacterium RIFCSPHIGHO2_02_FULL_39_11]|uniref:Glutamine amidotransferase subunit PdxT n=1 Tax=Candidatus Gottesmanbacteria bacterium RIFCSPHIGHO2_02_FULL_39_11 TaxID=1798382 RepID=A0A1F5ZPF2_9BACT|nr:MAG: glutamine amidotransferase subunit PdxT [Candidatus Gottesmanbacteria bacterium RIFCSPHIGHO2_02_FULL_39_11]